MADKKYRAGAIVVNAEQLAKIDEAMAAFKEIQGITLSRSQMLAWLAAQFLRQHQQGKEQPR